MTRYAENTSVPSDQSRAEIERTLRRYGAASFLYGWDADKALVGFTAANRQIRFELPMPDRKDFLYTPARGYERSAAQVDQEFEKAVRQRWRALALVIKAKLEAVETGITTFESEFLAHIVLPSGENVGDWLKPQIEEAYSSGIMPSLLPALPAAKA